MAKNAPLSTTSLTTSGLSAQSLGQDMARPLEWSDMLRDRLSATEMQMVVAGAMGDDLGENHLVDVLAPQLCDPASTLRLVMQRKRLRLNPYALLDKLNALPPAELSALHRKLAATLEEYRPVDLLLGGYLPSIHMLRVAGLVAPAGRAAWGLCSVVLEGENWFVYQIALGSDPGGSPASTETADQIAEALAFAVGRWRDQTSSAMHQLISDLVQISDLAHKLARLRGRYLRVHQNRGDVWIAEIPVQDLREDAACGDLEGLVLEGVNAPLALASAP